MFLIFNKTAFKHKVTEQNINYTMIVPLVNILLENIYINTYQGGYNICID